MTINKVLPALAVLILLWATAIGFGFITDEDIVEDLFGWGFLGLAVLAASFYPWPARRVG